MTDDPLPELRASDAEREQHADLLRQAAGDGRLTVDELDERLTAVYASKTHGELRRLVADVTVPGGAPAPTATAGSRMPIRRGARGSGWIVSVMSGHDRKGRWLVGPKLNVVNFMGGSDLDLNDAELADEVVEITIVSIMGGGNIRVPEGLNVEVTDFAFMGGNDVSLGDMRPDPGGPTLRLKLISIMGGSDIKRGRRVSWSERREQKRLERERRHGH